MEKRIKLTKKKQWEKMLEFMNTNPDIGRGKSKLGSNKSVVNQKCEQLAKELNSLGPPFRSSKEWQRVWINYKGNLKRKLSSNRQKFSLTPMEENVVEFLHFEKQTNPVGESFDVRTKFDLKQPEFTEVFENSSDKFFFESQENTVESDDVMPKVSKRPQINNTNEKEIERLQLLKKQTQNQNEILQSLTRIESTIYKNYKINEEILEIKKKKLRIAKEFHESRIELNKLKTEKLRKEIAINELTLARMRRDEF